MLCRSSRAVPSRALRSLVPLVQGSLPAPCTARAFSQARVLGFPRAPPIADLLARGAARVGTRYQPPTRNPYVDSYAATWSTHPESLFCCCGDATHRRRLGISHSLTEADVEAIEAQIRTVVERYVVCDTPEQWRAVEFADLALKSRVVRDVMAALDIAFTNPELTNIYDVPTLIAATTLHREGRVYYDDMFDVRDPVATFFARHRGPHAVVYTTEASEADRVYVPQLLPHESPLPPNLAFKPMRPKRYEAVVKPWLADTKPMADDAAAAAATDAPAAPAPGASAFQEV
ncbi:hypothetical protein CXG81DRAFT_19373 [Caulochytrium protostelioides]|uniref:Uncharacterized protein n=1 Tax=Caulochytrium protostelioides TaxID=1555241 RepID=A0A4P9X6A7_9FUNG|nr:hypothetical protein CXG81DRAFT_19373 [Caulochytrium protostelioides]|eukprot:RKP00717.1 hypothetical protein CXG81DRAFT_19373 [Caulochytrium protostelioides]